MSKLRKFVCGFYGARDRYEIPVALQDAGFLEVLLTDFYGRGGFLAKSGLARAAREHKKLPTDKVQGSMALVLARKVCGKLFGDPEQKNLWPDRLISNRIARTAARRSAHILTYEPYAVLKPHGGFPAGRKQAVFYYHPHVDAEDAIYRADHEKFPEFYGSERVTDSPWRRRTADAWKQADLVLCASSFTKQSLVAAGMEEERIVVVPYGVGERHTAKGIRHETIGTINEGTGGRRQVTEVGGTSMEHGAWSTEGETEYRRSEAGSRREVGGEMQTADGLRNTENGQRQGALRLLFVGRNPLRKGLHHLLMAWNAANKRPGDLLTIVCAAKPLEMQRLVEGRDDVRWLDSLSGEELGHLYRESDALVVPSLCEGFGHVYLEAMTCGCAVVGTRNSALPDIGDEKQGVFTVGVGDVDGLARLISDASFNTLIFRSVSEAAKQRASEFTWDRFRQGVIAALRSIAA